MSTLRPVAARLAALALGTASTVTGCATAPSDSPDRQASFACSNGQVVEVTFYGFEETAVVVRGAQRLELPQRDGPGGPVYTDGVNTLRGSGATQALRLGPAGSVSCRPVA